MHANRNAGGLQVSKWVLGIVGGIAAFLGLFIFFGGDDQSIGIGGDVSWRVGDIAAAWGYGLIAGGLVAAIVLWWLVRREQRLGVAPGGRHTSRTDLYVHGTVFLLVNAFLWVQDILIGDGLDYALWVTVPWGIGLAAHAVAEYRLEHPRTIPH